MTESSDQLRRCAGLPDQPDCYSPAEPGDIFCAAHRAQHEQLRQTPDPADLADIEQLADDYLTRHADDAPPQGGSLKDRPLLADTPTTRPTPVTATQLGYRLGMLVGAARMLADTCEQHPLSAVKPTAQLAVVYQALADLAEPFDAHYGEGCAWAAATDAAGLKETPR